MVLAYFKKLSVLLRGITSKHDGCCYCINCTHLFKTENQIKAHKNFCKNHNYCYIKIPENSENILKYNDGENL